jgi:hypothetical protein
MHGRMSAAWCAAVAMTMVLWSGSAAEAQRVPNTAMSALEVSVGVFLPGDPLDTAFTVQGGYQYFFTPRVGLRGNLGWTNPSFMGTGSTMRQIRTGADLIYNWEGGRWHPFVGAGGGAYFLQPRAGGQSFGPSGTQGGVNLLGGVEHFVGPLFTIKGEAAYHWISQGNLPWSASGLALTVGVKRYF